MSFGHFIAWIGSDRCSWFDFGARRRRHADDCTGGHGEGDAPWHL